MQQSNPVRLGGKREHCLSALPSHTDSKLFYFWTINTLLSVNLWLQHTKGHRGKTSARSYLKCFLAGAASEIKKSSFQTRGILPCPAHHIQPNAVSGKNGAPYNHNLPSCSCPCCTWSATFQAARSIPWRLRCPFWESLSWSPSPPSRASTCRASASPAASFRRVCCLESQQEQQGDCVCSQFIEPIRKYLLVATVAVAQSVKRPELRSLKGVQLSQREFDSQSRSRS